MLSEQNGLITSYTINVTQLETEEVEQLVTEATTLSVDVQPYSTYSFLVAASTDVGRGEFSTAVNVRTPEAGEMHISPPHFATI